MPDTLTIRPALPFDAEPLHAYLAALADERLPVLFARATPPVPERVLAMIARNTGDERYRLLLAVEDGGIAGMLDFIGAANAQQRHVGGFGMSVRRERRGRGIGTRLLRTLYGFTIGRGYRRLELDVFATNRGAIGLYEREGFLHEGRRRGAVMVGEAEVDLLLMAKRI
jgi:GNAT superfamily N-acetyltransferase